MKIFRLILLALATALCVINFWAVNYHDLWSKENTWVFFRILMALLLIVFLVRIIRNNNRNLPRKSRKTLN